MSVESAMRRIRSADRSKLDADDRDQQHEMYEKTLRALSDVDEDDEDEGITVVTEWILDRIESDGERPSSKAVRERAREFCRHNGYDLPDDSWLGT